MTEPRMYDRDSTTPIALLPCVDDAFSAMKKDAACAALDEMRCSAADALRRIAFGDHVAHRLRHVHEHHRGQHERHDAAELQHAAPSPLRNHPCGEKTA